MDSIFGDISGLWWGVGVIAISVLVSAVTLTVGRRASAEPAVSAAQTTPAGRLER